MKTKETSDFINCSDYMGQDYPKLTTNMFVKCFNGDFGKIAWTDGHRFKLGQNRFLHRANILSKPKKNIGNSISIMNIMVVA